jgi:hypothetical protein
MDSAPPIARRAPNRLQFTPTVKDEWNSRARPSQKDDVECIA